MSHHPWDELSKSLAEDLVPRRESLRRLGLVLAGTILSPLGLGTAFAGHQNPCKAFCKCRNKKQQNACLAACKACGNDPRFLCGSCTGGYACTDLANDRYNCGACGYVCDEPGPYEYGACIDGECRYTCADGAVYCNGFCTFLGWDPDNCGACGNLCPESAPYCNWGTCSVCPPDSAPCGNGCCPPGYLCVDGACQPPPGGDGCPNGCPTGWVCYVGSCCNPTVACCSPDCEPPPGW